MRLSPRVVPRAPGRAAALLIATPPCLRRRARRLSSRSLTGARSLKVLNCQLYSKGLR